TGNYAGKCGDAANPGTSSPTLFFEVTPAGGLQGRGLPSLPAVTSFTYDPATGKFVVNSAQVIGTVVFPTTGTVTVNYSVPGTSTNIVCNGILVNVETPTQQLNPAEVGEPINSLTGEYNLDPAPDLSLGGGPLMLDQRRHYGSDLALNGLTGSNGVNWRNSY